MTGNLCVVSVIVSGHNASMPDSNMPDTNKNHQRRTKIIATLGPATDDRTMMQQVLEAGANVLRINFSHGDEADHHGRVALVRSVAEELEVEVAILADLAGPKVRIGKFKDGAIELESDDAFTLHVEEAETAGTQQGIGVDYAGLTGDVSPGDVLLLDDGLISLEVTGVDAGEVHTRVLIGGELSDRKGLSIQGGGLSIAGLTDRDLESIKLAAELEVDYLAVSFPRSARDIIDARRLLREAGSDARVVAKIERSEAIEQLSNIVEASDAVLVARGDLGVEIGDAELPGLQKQIIRESLAQNRVVITATQMMQSMVESPIPTRAEVLDVANAVLDGTDAVMLSAETAVGNHPHKAVAAMHRVCLGAERHYASTVTPQQLTVRFQRIDQAIAMAAMFAATNVDVQAIIALTESGSTAQWLSRVRSAVPIYALSPNARSRRRMALYRDVYPVSYDPDSNEHNMNEVSWAAVKRLFDAGHLEPNRLVVLTMGASVGEEGGTNTMKILRVGEEGAAEHQARLDYR